MKIAIDARIIYTSTGRYVERLIAHLATLDSEHNYIVLLLQKDFERWQSPTPRFTKVVANFPPYTLREQFQYARLLYRLKPDLVHFTMPQQPILYWGRRVTTIHDLTLIDFVNRRRQGLLKDIYKNNIKPPIFRLVLWLVTRLSARIITPTEYIRQQVTQRFGVRPTKVTLTYEAGELTPVSPQPYPPMQGKSYILCVGNAYPYKNLQSVIRAAQLLKHTGCQLVLVGKHDFFYRELVDYVAQEHITNVHFTDFVSDENLAWLYQNAKLYVFASLSEGFGLPGLEAMLYGLPVLSSNASCLPEVYGEAAEYFNPHSVEELATKVDALLDSPDRRKQLREAGLKQVAKYSWAKMAKETLQVYQSVLKH
jgi:glycosyltransferase involved in cell wall biosynthesis